MPTGSSGLYELIVNQESEGQVCLNVFWYRAQDGEDGAGLDLAIQFATVVIPDWLAFISNTVEIIDIIVRNVGTANVDQVHPQGLFGEKVGPVQPIFNAATATLIRSSKDAGTGHKRVGGILEADVTNGLLVPPGSGEWTTLVNHFDSVLDGPGPTDFEPVLVNRKSLDSFPPSFEYAVIVDVEAKARITSQNTRKIGRGV